MNLPCSCCDSPTNWRCSDCMFDKQLVPVCTQASCRDLHEAEFHPELVLGPALFSDLQPAES